MSFLLLCKFSIIYFSENAQLCDGNDRNLFYKLMARPLVPKLLRYVEWISLGLLMLRMLYRLFTMGSLSATEDIGIGTVVLMTGLSVISVEHRSLSQRRLYVLAGLAVLMPIRLLPFPMNWDVFSIGSLIYLFFAKICFLLPRREVIAVVLLTGLVWHGGLVWSYSSLVEPLQVAILQYQETLVEMADIARRSSPWMRAFRVAVDMLAGTLPFIGLMVWLCFKATSERKNRQAVLALSAQVEMLNTDLERTRVARDVHDSLGHTLTALDIQLKLAQAIYPKQPNRALTALTQAKGLAEQSLVDIQQTVEMTQPASFDLREALELLVAQMNQSQNCLFESCIELPKLSLEISEQLYLLIKEGVTNIQKHSRATAAQLYTQTGLDSISINLVDNGIGFDPDVQTSGFGLQGMSERAQALGGQLSIRSKSGKGTFVAITVPHSASL